MNSDADRAAYLQCLARAQRRTGVRVCSYVTMGTHAHQVPSCSHEPLGSYLLRLNTAFGRWWNKHHGGYGPVFAERPSSDVISDEEGLARVVAYVHNNERRAGLVTCPSQSKRSSHPAFIGLVRAPRFLDVEWTLAAMGFSATGAGRAAFHDYVVSRSGLPRDPLLGGPGASCPDTAKRVLEVAAARHGVPTEALCRPRERTLKALRLVVIATLHELFGCEVRHIAAALGVSPSYVSRLRPQWRSKGSSLLVEEYLQAEGLRERVS